MVWGADWIRDEYSVEVGTLKTINEPDSSANNQVSLFVEDEITVADDLWFTIGTRQYHSELTDHDWAAKAALVWEAQPQHFFRASISRSFARPTLQTYFISQDRGNGPILVSADDLGNESLVSYELGYRGQLTEKFELNLELFFNQNKDLIGKDATVKPIIEDHVLDVDTYGLETSIKYKPRQWWHIRATYSYAHQPEEDDLNADSSALRVFTIPRHTGTLMNRFYLGDTTTINTQFFFSDSYFNDRDGARKVEIDPFVRFDLRLAKRFGDALEVAIGATNLNQHFHDEGGSDEVPRTYYLQFFYEFSTPKGA